MTKLDKKTTKQYHRIFANTISIEISVLPNYIQKLLHQTSMLHL